MLQNYVVKHIISNFASVFHGIRFKVKRLFVARTSNFFLLIPIHTISFCPELEVDAVVVVKKDNIFA